MTPAERQKLIMIPGMLGGDHAGERDNAAILAVRIVRAAGLTWEQVLGTPPAASASTSNSNSTELTRIDACLVQAERLSLWEQEFLAPIRSQLRWTGRRRLSERQAALLSRIEDKLGGM
jgi:hypothetical protein